MAKKTNTIQNDPEFTEVEMDDNLESIGGKAFMQALADVVDLPNVPTEVTAEQANDILTALYKAMQEFPLHKMSKSKLEAAVKSADKIDDGKALSQARMDEILKEKKDITDLTGKLVMKYKAETVLSDEDREKLVLSINKIRYRVFQMPLKADGTPLTALEYPVWEKQYISS